MKPGSRDVYEKCPSCERTLPVWALTKGKCEACRIKDLLVPPFSR